MPEVAAQQVTLPRGTAGESGVYIGTEEPTDPDVNVWIDPNGDADEPEDSTYTLPIATPETLGGVKPVNKAEDMTQPVGVDELGGLWTAMGGGNAISIADELIIDFVAEEEVTQVDIPLTELAERLNNAAEIITSIRVEKPTVDEGTKYETFAVKLFRQSGGGWYPTDFFDGEISPTNYISYGKQGLGFSIIYRNLFSSTIKLQYAENINVAHSKKTLIDGRPIKGTYITTSDILRIISGLPMGVGTTIKVYARGYME
jgi:hypothetical protein